MAAVLQLWQFKGNAALREAGFWLFAALIHMFGESISVKTEVVQCSRSFPALLLCC